MESATLAAFVLLVACAICLTAVAGDHPADFTPANGFAGESEGHGSLKLLFRKPRAFHVRSVGSAREDGGFELRQTVVFAGKAPTTRTWMITTVRPNYYRATLSNAPGPVTGYTVGPRLFLRYRVKGPLVMHQALTLLADGKTIDNVGTVTLLGLRVGHLHETITREATGADQRGNSD